MIAWFAYVRHADVPARVRGWVVVDGLGPVHGVWSVLMRWTGAAEPGEGEPGEGEPGEGNDAGT